MKTYDVLAFGHNSCEHDISIITACLMQGNGLRPLYFDRQGQPYLLKGTIEPNDFLPDAKLRRVKCALLAGDNTLYKRRGKFLRPLFKIRAALMCFHGGAGEKGEIQSLLRLCNIAYSGSEPLQSALCMDKSFCKKVLKESGFPTLSSFTLFAKEQIAEKFDFPIIVKPSRQGSSIGISVAHNQEQLNQALTDAFAYDNKVIVEQFLQNALEINCAALIDGQNIMVSDVECPNKGRGIYTYEQKYINKQVLGQDCNIEENVRLQIQSLTYDVCKTFQLYGVVRIDYLYCDGKIYLNEINTIPGSLAFHLFAKQMSKRQFVGKLIEGALEKQAKEKEVITCFTSSVLNQSTIKCKK